MKPSNIIEMIAAKTIWLTGVSGAGKSTIAQRMRHKHFQDYVIIDGDELRRGICSDLGFSDEDRMKNVERAAYICKMLNIQGIKTIACMMSPLESHRERAREILGDCTFMVYVSCSMDEVKRRDPKGLYNKFDEGFIKGMSGLDAPFEVPVNIDTVVNTEFISLEDCVSNIVESHKIWGHKKHILLLKSLKKSDL
jgi:adenylyl-sulfate kinase